MDKMWSYLSPIVNLFKNIRSTDTDINILLLGETGVGKSTFINSLSNYFTYTNFKKAQKNKTSVLVPVNLNLSDGNKICGTPDPNESHKKGASATQYVKVYEFPIKVDNKKLKLKLVDTPGVGDPRGIEQDNIHIDNMLAYLATLKKVHGICFVMKANQSRFTNFVEYCLKQILSRLDKSASENIIFILTYSKTAQYSAGEAKYNCLEPLVESIRSKPPHVNIPLDENNVFSMDNEAFKALLEIQEGKKFARRDLTSFSESWIASANECRRLLTYILGDTKTPALKAHEVENTLSVNKVRFLIEQLATPIAEVSELIQDNLRLLDRHRQNLTLDDQTLAQLRNNLYLPGVDLQVVELDFPVTVCSSVNCTEIVKVDDLTKRHYIQRCHKGCHLNGIPKEEIGHPGLIRCAAMSGENCKKCGCHWKVHVHIYKNTEKINVRVVDKNIQTSIKTKEDAGQKIDELMKELNLQMQELEAEGDIISESIAKFTYFLEEHALTPFNDAYSSYIKQLIKNEEHLGKFADPTVIEKLRQLLQKHEHLQKIFQQSTGKFQSSGDLTLEGIQKTIDRLYSLKHMGPKIEELIRKTNACRSQETQKNFNSVVSEEFDVDEVQYYGGNNAAGFDNYDDDSPEMCGETGSEDAPESSKKFDARKVDDWVKVRTGGKSGRNSKKINRKSL